MLAHLQVVLAKLPILRWVINTRFQSFGLFFFADVEKKFKQKNSVIREIFLKRIDLLVALLPNRFWNQIQPPRYEDIFVMGAIENGDVSITRHKFMHAPEKVMSEFFV